MRCRVLESNQQALPSGQLSLRHTAMLFRLSTRPGPESSRAYR